jgi:hypothetical protein
MEGVPTHPVLALLLCVLVLGCWRSHSIDAVDGSSDGPSDRTEEHVEPDAETDGAADPLDAIEDPEADAETDGMGRCPDGYPEEPYGWTGSISWDHARMRADWIEEGDTFPNVCLPDQDGEIRCVGEHACSTEVDFIVYVFQAFW